MFHHWFVALALAGVANNAQIESSNLPVVASGVYDVNQRSFDLSVRNDGSPGVVAWMVELTWHYPDATESHEFVSVDSYEQAAGLPDAPSGNVVLSQGQSMQRRHAVPSRAGGVVPDKLTLRPHAVILEGNRAFGDRGAIERILSRRVEDGHVWADALSRLQAVQASTPDGANLFGRVRQGLDAVASENSQLGSVTRTLLYGIRSAEQSGEDPRAVIERLVQQAQRHVEAAERFGVQAATK